MSIGPGVVDNLLRRVAALEQQSRPPSGEQLSQNYLTVDANGLVGASFTGQVHATGLVLDQGAGTLSQIAWLRSDGAVIAHIWGQEAGGTLDSLTLQSEVASAGNAAAAEIVADNAGAVAQFAVRAQSSNGFYYAKATANTFTRTVIDSTGASDFPQLGSTARSIAGRVNVSFAASNQASTAPVITVPGAAGACQAVALSGVAGLTPTFCAATDNANGSVVLQCFSANLTAITGNTTIFYLIWGN